MGECEAVDESDDDELGSSVAGITASGLLSRHQEQEFFSDGVNESLGERDTIRWVRSNPYFCCGSDHGLRRRCKSSGLAFEVTPGVPDPLQLPCLTVSNLINIR